jgi:hypothetical protein
MPALVGVLAWSGRAGSVACGIAGAVMLSISNYHTPGGLTTSGALLAVAAAGWILWGFFGRGVRWTYWFVLVIDVAGLGICAAVASGVWNPGLIEDVHGLAVRASGAAALLACVFAILILPRTRRHFSSEGLRLSIKSRLRAQA